jgi:DNA repair photolyase
VALDWDMKNVNLIEAKSVLQKSGIPGVDFVINPYTGCLHGCVYCYARFMKRFTGHSEPWGTFLDVKINAPEVLKKQLAGKGISQQNMVFLSSVTDPYQPYEKKYELTRDLLKILLEYQVPISILTKSDLILRDMDLLSRFESCTVGMSLMTLDDKLARRLEPRATPPINRIQALRSLHNRGISTWAFISPFLPGLSNIEQTLKALSGFVDEIGVEAINIRGGNWTGVEKVLVKHYPESLDDCRRLSRDENYWWVLENEVKQMTDKHRIELMGFFTH